MSDLVSQFKSIIEGEKEKYYDTLESKLDRLCRDLIDKAVDFRLTDPEAHDFTGNLINSIVCALYRKGQLIRTYHPYDIMPPIQNKMTSPKHYYFTRDWRGDESYYEPEIKTDTGNGRRDAERFVSTYISMKGAEFEVLVAYTTEYAAWVEMERVTTGYMYLFQYVNAINIDSYVNS